MKVRVVRLVGLILSVDTVLKEPVMGRSVADGSIFSKVCEEIQFIDAPESNKVYILYPFIDNGTTFSLKCSMSDWGDEVTS